MYALLESGQAENPWPSMSGATQVKPSLVKWLNWLDQMSALPPTPCRKNRRGRLSGEELCSGAVGGGRVVGVVVGSGIGAMLSKVSSRSRFRAYPASVSSAGIVSVSEPSATSSSSSSSSSSSVIIFEEDHLYTLECLQLHNIDLF